MKVLKDLDQNYLQELDDQPWNSCEILQGFRSEFWWPILVSNNSDDYQILQQLNDHMILIKNSRDFDQNSRVLKKTKRRGTE
jgi:hypothetical protein